MSYPMNNTIYFVIFSLFFCLPDLFAQDSNITINKKVVTLKEVVVRSNLNVPAFIERVKSDTTFYKAFRNLKVLGYTSLNDIQLYNKKGKLTASLHSRSQQLVKNGCRYLTLKSHQQCAAAGIAEEPGAVAVIDALVLARAAAQTVAARYVVAQDEQSASVSRKKLA